MGFIERLKEEKETREHAEAERRRTEEECKAAVVVQRQQQQDAERLRREARKNQAKQFRDENGIGSLVIELKRLIDGSTFVQERDHIQPRDKDSVLDGFGWDESYGGQVASRTYKYSGKLIVAETYPDGTVQVHGGLFGSSKIPLVQWRNNKNVLESALEKAYYHPARYTRREYYRGSSIDGPCLPGNALISVPSGLMPLKNLKSGDLVWTTDRFGHRVQAVIIQKTKRIVSKDHKMAHIVLKDGRELIVSHGHPTIDNKEIGYLVKGQILDKSQIVSVEIMPYKEKYTYDILPSGDTGGYWVNSILIGSTLSNQFKQTLNFA